MSVIHLTPNTGKVASVTSTQWNQNHTIGDFLANANVASIPPGSPVYCSAPGSIDLAKADATAECLGLAWLPSPTSPPVAIPPGSAGLAQEVDSLLLTTDQWDTVTGGSGGLTPRTRYYVSATTAGKLTAVAPSSSGQFMVSVGTALTTTLMRLRVQPPIGL